jgi:hypothetical protein
LTKNNGTGENGSPESIFDGSEAGLREGICGKPPMVQVGGNFNFVGKVVDIESSDNAEVFVSSSPGNHGGVFVKGVGLKLFRIARNLHALTFGKGKASRFDTAFVAAASADVFLIGGSDPGKVRVSGEGFPRPLGSVVAFKIS